VRFEGIYSRRHAIRHSGFVILSTFVIRHSSFFALLISSLRIRFASMHDKAASSTIAPPRPLAPALAPANALSPVPARASLRVLLVDDDPLNRRALARTLETSGFEVIECRDGTEAFQVLEEIGPALLVLDYELPEFNGAQISEVIRQDPNPAIAQVPIIMLTRHAGAEDEIECLEAGADDFVVKPANARVLKARIETHARVYLLRRQLEEQKRELEKYREDHERDLEAAQLTQQAIIPNRMPALDGWDFAADYHPLIQVGGDVYGWLGLSDGGLLTFIADATGHGASAALLTALTKLLFRHAVAASSSPAEIMKHVNEELYAVFKGKSFMTALCVALHGGSGRIVASGAGHPPLFIARPNARVDTIPSPSPPLGLGPKLDTSESVADLEIGDALILYTDGLYAVTNPQGLRLTPAHFRDLVPTAAPSGQDFLATILEKLKAHAAGQPFPDDIAAIAAMRTTPAEAPVMDWEL
jgi:phosphoserine phosphatase RsbU/P